MKIVYQWMVTRADRKARHFWESGDPISAVRYARTAQKWERRINGI